MFLHRIMLRGFDNFNRWAMVEEPRCPVRTRDSHRTHAHGWGLIFLTWWLVVVR